MHANTNPTSRLDQSLDRAAQLATGRADVTARPSQRSLSTSILVAMESAQHVAAEATTGTGKSLAYLVPAAIRAATDNERTVISTETLALQAQLRDKDAPAAVEAVSAVLGLPAPTVAVLKGWSNYACTLSAVASASELSPVPSKSPEKLRAAIDTIPGETADLVRWALDEVTTGGSGDRATYPGNASGEDWQLVSTTPAECPGVAECPFGEHCLPAKARDAAAAADIIVTNHSMLAVQAATSAPVVIGSKKLGPIHHLVVDEAHGLASAVRNQGSASVNAWRINDALRSVERLLDRPGKAKSLREDGVELAKALDKHLAGRLAHAAGGTGSSSRSSSNIATVAADDNPFDGLDEAITAWVGRARRLVPKPLDAHSTKEMVARYRALGRLDALVADVSAAACGDNGVARWIERSERQTTPVSALGMELTGTSLKMAPVDVSGMLRTNLYERQADDHPSEETEVSDGPDETPDQAEVVTESFEMSVTVVSATLPASFVVDLGVNARKVEYPSPFADGYDHSLLFIPKATAAELGRPGERRATFDVYRHPEWAARVICDLVGANQGAALVLAATTDAGRLYAERLRRTYPKMAVYSQWDGPPLRRLIAEWRDDHGSVMVGTKSLMTGVDAPGATCTLVVVDRCPRSAPNPVDDARVENLRKRLDIDRWAADRMVYVADAALLLEQAAGRLIRSSTDTGMVAICDPRLLPPRLGDFHYPEPTRKTYFAALERFPHRTSGMDKALAYLGAQSTARTTSVGRTRRTARPKVA